MAPQSISKITFVTPLKGIGHSAFTSEGMALVPLRWLPVYGGAGKERKKTAFKTMSAHQGFLM